MSERATATSLLASCWRPEQTEIVHTKKATNTLLATHMNSLTMASDSASVCGSVCSFMGERAYFEISERVESILQRKSNRTCADCQAPNPQWASLLLKGPECVEGLGAVICERCAVQHYHQLGEDRAFIKYLAYFHEWTHPELDLLEYCGNQLVNKVYEANLIAQLGERSYQHTDGKKQGKFIKKKYRKCRYKCQG